MFRSNSQKCDKELQNILHLSDTILNESLKIRGENDSDTSLAKILLETGKITEEKLAHSLASHFGLAIVKPSDYPPLPVLENTISTRFLNEYEIIPLADTSRGIEVAVVDLQDPSLNESFMMAFNKPVVMKIAILSQFVNAFERLYGNNQSEMNQIVGPCDPPEDAENGNDTEQLMDMANEAPVVRLVNYIIKQAINNRASDIHIEPFEKQMKIRHRIDGALTNVDAPPNHSTAAVISRVKIMAKLDIAERRLPQDGRIKIKIEEKDVDLRVSTMPTRYGESVVIRILVNESVIMDFASLGFSGKPLDDFQNILRQPNGMLLVTGPTGSGKTTTLYTALNQLNSPRCKILTVEDPIEYYLEGINQIQVSPKIGLTFSNVLRSMVRQDPDVIMVGEIRDLETAKIAIQSALTGHMVLSTLHTNDAPSSLSRLLDMGVDDYLITSAVNGILAQRLVRKLCSHCKKKIPTTAKQVQDFGLERFAKEDPIMLYQPVGCDKCNGTGYYGRCIIVEMMIITDHIRMLVVQRADAGKIRKEAFNAGMRTMLEDGIGKCLSGLTTIDELLIVVPDAANIIYERTTALEESTLPFLSNQSYPRCLARTLHNGQIEKFLIDKKTMTIGRGKSCNFRLDAKDVSRHHATLMVENDHLYIKDNNSANGTYVNNNRISGVCEVNNHDSIVLSKTVEFLVLTELDDDQPSTSDETVKHDGVALSLIEDTAQTKSQALPPQKQITSGWSIERILDNGDTAKIPVNETLTIGRGKSCSLKINTNDVSRHHATISIKDNCLNIEDNGSANGTYVNTKQISHIMELHNHDIINISKIAKLRVLYEPVEQSHDVS